ALHAGSGKRIKGPTFGAVLACGHSFAREDFAFPPIETRQVTTTSQSCPNQTVGIDIDTARKEALLRGLRIIKRRLICLGHTGSPFHPNNFTRRAGYGSPYNSIVGRIGNDAVDAVHLDRLVDFRIDLTIAIDVVISAAPSLRRFFAAGLLENIQVHVGEASR